MSERHYSADDCELDEARAYTQDSLQEDEDTCDVCKKVRKHDELKAYDGVIVCSDCEQTGWPE